jgi:hypothetical protein
MRGLIKENESRRLMILYAEEGLSQPAKNLLPLLASKMDYYLVTEERDKEFAKLYSMRIRSFPAAKFPVQKAWTIRLLSVRILRTAKVDLIHSHSGTDFLLPRTVPIVTHIHGSWLVNWRRKWRAARPPRKI